MLAYQIGQEEAFKTLYERHQKRVYGFLMGKLRTAELADEAFQMTFLKLHQSRHQYDAKLPFTPWLFTLCRNAMIDTIRIRNRTHRKEELNPIAIETAKTEATQETFHQGQSLEKVPGLETLSPKQREAVELRYFEDLPFEEIAKRLEISPTNARQIVSRAIRALKKWIGTQERGDA